MGKLFDDCASAGLGHVAYSLATVVPVVASECPPRDPEAPTPRAANKEADPIDMISGWTCEDLSGKGELSLWGMGLSGPLGIKTL